MRRCDWRWVDGRWSDGRWLKMDEGKEGENSRGMVLIIVRFALTQEGKKCQKVVGSFAGLNWATVIKSCLLSIIFMIQYFIALEKVNSTVSFLNIAQAGQSTWRSLFRAFWIHLIHDPRSHTRQATD